jgi:hypothetical protein
MARKRDDACEYTKEKALPNCVTRDAAANGRFGAPLVRKAISPRVGRGLRWVAIRSG